MPRPGSKSASRRTRFGAAAAELAVILPILFFLFAIAVDYGRIFYFTQTLRAAARNGAYFASNYPGLYSFQNADQVTRADLTNLSPAPDVAICYSLNAAGPFTSTTPTTTGYVEVRVTWTFNSITKFPLVPQNKVLQGSSRMKVAPVTPTFP
jgi:Flp pilus assembly protein TadG